MGIAHVSADNLNAPLCDVSWCVSHPRPCQYGIVGAGGVGMAIQRTRTDFHIGQPFHSIKGGAACADANVDLRMDAKLVHGLSTPVHVGRATSQSGS